jgi:hypothetical protein
VKPPEHFDVNEVLCITKRLKKIISSSHQCRIYYNMCRKCSAVRDRAGCGVPVLGDTFALLIATDTMRLTQ